ncbi:hypothetical protein BKA69DRAFT_1177715 [Paraphysoderma sedebokerense]|nr:hypothetical protein BKA69DRAFT_1177715 [Paraphysoderma sedebokerense]
MYNPNQPPSQQFKQPMNIPRGTPLPQQMMPPPGTPASMMPMASGMPAMQGMQMPMGMPMGMNMNMNMNMGMPMGSQGSGNPNMQNVKRSSSMGPSGNIGGGGGSTTANTSSSSVASSSSTTVGPMGDGGGYNKVIKKKKPPPQSLTLPPSLATTIPESNLYNRLTDMEKKIDATILRKKLDAQEILGKSIKTKRTLRLFISNYADHPNIREFDADDVPPNWTLRIEGRLLEPATKSKSSSALPPRKLSHFLKSVVIEAEKENGSSEVVEWRKSTTATPFDGLELKRSFTLSPSAMTSPNFRTRIIITLDHGPEKFKISDDLAAILDFDVSGVPKISVDQCKTKKEVVVGIWGYVKHHNLQDQDDKRIVNCDEKLAKIFNCERFLFPQIPDMVTRFLCPPDPICIAYTIRTDKPFSLSKTAYDVEVEIDDVGSRSKYSNFVAGVGYSKEIAVVDEKLTTLLTNLHNHRLKHSFLSTFASSPAEFINQYIASQSRDLEIIVGDKRINKEEVRRSDFWKAEEVEEVVKVVGSGLGKRT